MLQKVIVWFLKLTPQTKRWFWKRWYNIFARRYNNLSLRCMNYGYYDKGFSPTLLPEDEQERYPLQLYHHVASQARISGKAVLEVGSGRGGGASYIAKTLGPSHYTGIDISSTAVDLCSRFYSQENLDFRVGDSESIPLEDSSVDIVINVESSHCYGSIPRFLKEVHRVLRPGGKFLFCDFRLSSQVDELLSEFAPAGFKQESYSDITPNVIEALRRLSEYRRAEIQSKMPRFLHSTLEAFAGVEGSKVFTSFDDGTLRYISASFEKR